MIALKDKFDVIAHHRKLGKSSKFADEIARRINIWFFDFRGFVFIRAQLKVEIRDSIDRQV